MITMQERAEVNKLLGIDSSVISPPRHRRALPGARPLAASGLPDRRRALPPAGRDHPPRRRRVGLRARGRSSRRRDPPEERRSPDSSGRRSHRRRRDESRARRVRTGRERDRRLVVARRTPRRPACPITTHILQAFVTEPVKPFLDVVLVSSQLHVYVSQTDAGEFLIGAEIEPYTTYKGAGTSRSRVLGGARSSCSARRRRTWTGLCDLSPDYSPILGKTEIDNFHVSTGWGTYGFKAAPIVGVARRAVASGGRGPDRALRAGALPRHLVELAAAAVSH